MRVSIPLLDTTQSLTLSSSNVRSRFIYPPLLRPICTYVHQSRFSGGHILIIYRFQPITTSLCAIAQAPRKCNDYSDRLGV